MTNNKLSQHLMIINERIIARWNRHDYVHRMAVFACL
jgi:hypothetical protein